MIRRRDLLTVPLALLAVPARAFVRWHEAALPSAAPIIESLYRHPFITGLIDGTLPRESFLWYHAQNYHYLAGFEASLSALARRLPDEKDRRRLLRWASDTASLMPWTRDLLQTWGKRHRPEGFLALRPTTRRYIDWEQTNANRAPLSVAWATLLPCFWVYGEVGRFVEQQRYEASPYAAWLAGYADPAYDATVEEAVALADRLSDAEIGLRSTMTAAFLRSVNYEVRLWDAAVQLEKASGD